MRAASASALLLGLLALLLAAAAEAKPPAAATALLNEGLRLIDKGQPDGALAKFDELDAFMAGKPADRQLTVDLHVDRGVCLLRLHRFKDGP